MVLAAAVSSGSRNAVVNEDVAAPGHPGPPADNKWQSAILRSEGSRPSFSTDVNGLIQTYNEGAELLLDYPAAEVVGNMTAEHFSDDHDNRLRARALSREFGADVQPGFSSLVFKAVRTAVQCGRP